MNPKRTGHFLNRRAFVSLASSLLSFAVILCMTGSHGCVSNNNTDFPNRLVGADGQMFTVEDLEEVANDPDLSDDEKREAFRELGIEDEELIDALLEL